MYNSGFARIISDNLKKVVIRKQEAEECDATNVERSDKAGNKKTPALRGRRCNAVN